MLRASAGTNSWSHQLPVQLRYLVDIYHGGSPCRHASTSSCPYPYPTQQRPTPHQIFHLPHGASQSDIKTRYYELVRIHHPDSPSARLLSPQTALTRFQSVSSAYDILRGKLPPPGSHSPYSPFHQPADDIEAEIRRRQTLYRRRNTEWTRAQSSAGMDSASAWDPGRSADERWKDRVIVFAGIITLAIGLYPSIFMLKGAVDENHVLASKNLGQAREDAKEFGDTRRRELRRRVSEFRFLDKVTEDEMQRERGSSRVLAIEAPKGGEGARKE